MSQASAELRTGQKENAGKAMQQAVAALRTAARRIASQQRETPNTGSGEGGSAKKQDNDLHTLPAMQMQFKGKPWGELPGEIRNQIISDMKARYGEDYAAYIKRYFEQLAERK